MLRTLRKQKQVTLPRNVDVKAVQAEEILDHLGREKLLTVATMMHVPISKLENHEELVKKIMGNFPKTGHALEKAVKRYVCQDDSLLTDLSQPKKDAIIQSCGIKMESEESEDDGMKWGEVEK